MGIKINRSGCVPGQRDAQGLSRMEMNLVTQRPHSKAGQKARDMRNCTKVNVDSLLKCIATAMEVVVSKEL